MIEKLKANILKNFQTHTKWDSKLVNQAWFGIFKYRANSLLAPKPMASPVDKMAQFLKKPWTLFPHNPIICQKTENKKKALPARKANYNQYRANTLLQTEGAFLCIFGRRETKEEAYHCSNNQGKHFKQISHWISSWCNHLLSHFLFTALKNLYNLYEEELIATKYKELLQVDLKKDTTKKGNFQRALISSHRRNT